MLSTVLGIGALCYAPIANDHITTQPVTDQAEACVVLRSANAPTRHTSLVASRAYQSKHYLYGKLSLSHFLSNLLTIEKAVRLLKLKINEPIGGWISLNLQRTTQDFNEKYLMSRSETRSLTQCLGE